MRFSSYCFLWKVIPQSKFSFKFILNYESSQMKSDPGHYNYWPYIERPKLDWPDGKNIAFWVAPNIENYEFQPPSNPHRLPTPRPVPDIIHYSHRDYGNRVGFWRMLEAMDQYGVRGSVSLNVATLDHHPEVIEECKSRFSATEFTIHDIFMA